MVRHVLVSLCALPALVAGCAPLVSMDPPSPDGPRITNLEVRPSSVAAGCPLTVAFAYDAAGDELVRVVAAWSRSLGRRGAVGHTVLEVPPRRWPAIRGAR